MSDQSKNDRSAGMEQDQGISTSVALTSASPLEIRHLQGGSHINLARMPVLTYAELDEDLAARDEDKEATDLDRDPNDPIDPWHTDTRKVPNLTDPQDGTYLEGERHVCFFHEHIGKFIPLPGVHWHFGKADQDIGIGGSGKVLIWKVGDSDDHEASEQKVTAHDWYGLGAKRGASILVYQHLQSRRWYFISFPAHGALVDACFSIEARLSDATIGAGFGTTATPIPYDEADIDVGAGFILSTAGPTQGEITVIAGGLVELYHQDAGSVSGTMVGENISQWWIEHKRAGGAFAAIEDTKTLLHHPNIGNGQETKFLKKQFVAAYGDVFRVQAKRIVGSDTLQADSLSGGGPTSYLGIHFLCPADTTDYEPELTNTTGGDQYPKMVGYFGLEETSGARGNESGAALDLNDVGTTATGSASGFVNNAVQFDDNGNELEANYSGVTDLRPASERFNIAFWIYVEDLSNGNPSAYHQIVGLDGITGWQVHLDKTQGIRWQVTGPGFTTTATSYVSLDLNKWYFFVGRVDGPNQQISMRVRAADGSLNETHTATGPASYDWATPPGNYSLSIRNSNGALNVEYRIDELGIWSDQVLTIGQENYLFGAGRGRELL